MLQYTERKDDRERWGEGGEGLSVQKTVSHLRAFRGERGKQPETKGGGGGIDRAVHCNRKGWVVTGQVLLLLRQEEMMN